MNSNKKIYLLRHRRRRRNNYKHKGSRILVRVVGALLVLSLVSVIVTAASGVGLVVGVYAYYAKDLPDPEAIETRQVQYETTKIYDRTGQHLLYEMFDPRLGDRTIVPLERIPLYLREATIAAEDRNFYENPGFNLRGLARAFWSNISESVESQFGFRLPYASAGFQGGSSITQQLVKNVLIPSDERYIRSYERKIKELILASEISRRYPGREGKDKILEWYLNNIFYGNLANGVEAASQTYFGKHVQELNLAECAMLAALPQNPWLNPIDNPDKAKERQELILDFMVRDGYITEAEAEAAKKEPLQVASITQRFDITAPHFVMYVRKLLEDEFGPDMVYRGGLKVYTTIDLEKQTLAEEIARKHIEELKNDPKGDRHVTNAAVVTIRPKTGEILVMVGSLDYFDKDIDGQVNVALANRQPGSSFKPFTYVTALAQGYTPATMIMDVRTCPNPNDPAWCPENYPDRHGRRTYSGPERLRLALARSLNIPAVKVLDWVGVGNVIKTAHRMGITTLNRDLDFYGLSLTLGGGEVKLLDMAYAFGVFANGGVMAGQPTRNPRPGYRELDPVAILRVEDAQGRVLKEYTRPQVRDVLSPQLAYLMDDILSDNQARIATFGVNNKLHFEDGRPVAAKTGTTDNWKDAWTIGFTPQYVTGVWVGNSDNSSMERVPGSLGAAPIWHDFMEAILKDEPVEKFTRPPGIVEAEVCPVSGMLPTEHCPPPVKEIFIEGTEPTQYCTVHQAFRINKETGKLATVYTPPELVEERVYEIYPPEAQDWVRENGIPQPPTQYDDQYGPSLAAGDVAIISPNPYAYISQGVVVRGSAKPPGFSLWRLEYGEGINPSAWSQIGGDHYDPRDNADLDYWDVSQLNGLYTLQLRVVKGDGSYQDAAIQVTVDNISPTVRIEHPWDGKVYVMEEDELVNIKADAQDNVSMDRVEFYIDGQLFDTTTVPPYNRKWVISMTDSIPVPGTVVTSTRVITNPDGTRSEEVITLTQVITSEVMIDDQPHIVYTQVFSGGRRIISDTVGYTETHQIHVVAYDAAGNRAESEKVQIFVVHKPKEEEKSGPAAWLRPGWDAAYIGSERPPWRM